MLPSRRITCELHVRKLLLSGVLPPVTTCPEELVFYVSFQKDDFPAPEATIAAGWIFPASPSFSRSGLRRQVEVFIKLPTSPSGTGELLVAPQRMETQ